MAQATSNAPSNFTSATTPSFIPYPVAASGHIYQGRPVFLDTAGNANAGVASGRRFVGFAQLEADNSGGAAGAIVVNVTPVGQGPDGQYYDLTAVGADQTWVGAVLYWVDNTTIAKTDGNNVICGVGTQFLSSTLVQVNTGQRA
jgi:hypothetical protein